MNSFYIRIPGLGESFGNSHLSSRRPVRGARILWGCATLP